MVITMIQSESNVTTGIADNVEAALYDVEQLEEQYDDWHELSRAEKLERLEEEDPEDTITAHNATTISFREHLVSLINGDEVEDPVDVTHMAFGSNDDPEDANDSHLSQEHSRFEIDDHINRGEEYGTVVLLTSDDANGESLLEAALVTEDSEGASGDMAINRVLLEDDEDRLDPKTENHAVTIKIDLEFQDSSQLS